MKDNIKKNSVDDILQRIRAFADQAHGDQVRKYAPERYISHPIRVMESCRRYTNDVTILSAALLHDVLEDTDVSEDELRDFLITLMDPKDAEKTLMLVKELTDVYVKSRFPKLNRRQRKNKELERLEKSSPDSQLIKYADIIDNAMEIVEQDPDFAKTYLHECRAILRKLNKGNGILYNEAVRTIDNGLRALKA